jgi:methyl-accepting chemotaxis protein
MAPLSKQLQQRISDENLYGNSHTAVKTLADPDLMSQIQNGSTSPLFQVTPALTGQTYQTYAVHCQVVPWTYLVLRPVNTITQAATQQDFYLFLIAAIVTALAAIVGLFVGRSITQPILQSVSSLIKSSEMLKTLANRERVTATEQKWIVDSAQTGLKSVQYYAEASNIASRKLDETGRDLLQYRDRMDARTMGQHLNDVIATANYLEKAASHQEQSSKRLSTAIRITTQVTEQLLAGATSASDAADQLEDVITQLRRVVGE